MRRAWRWLATALVALAAVPVALIAALSAIDAEIYRDALVEQVEAATGRSFTIGGALRLVPGLRPALVAERVRLGNPPAGPPGDLLRVERIEARLPLIPLLRGDIRIERLTLLRPEIGFVPDGKRSGNWAFPATGADTGPAGDAGSLRVSVRDALIRDGTARYRDPSTGREWQAAIAEARLRAPSPEARIRFSLRGTFREEAFSISGDGPPIEGLGKPEAWPVAIKAEIGAAAVEMSGTIALFGPRGSADLSADVAATVEDPRRLGGIFDTTLPTLKPLEAKGQVHVYGDRVRVEGLQAVIGTSGLSGEVEVILAEARPRVAGSLAGETVDLADFGLIDDAPVDESPVDESPVGEVPVGEVPVGEVPAEGSEPTPASARPGPRERLFPDDPLPFDRLGDVDLDLALKADRLIAGRLDVANLTASVTLEDRRLAVAPVEADFAGGHARGALRIDASAPLPLLSARLESSGLDLAILFAMAAVETRLTGTANFTADVAGEGVSVRSAIESLEGDVGLDLLQGAIPGRLLDLLGEDLARRLLAGGAGAGTTPLRCGVARFVIRGGIAEAKALALDSARVSLTGSGRTDLGREALDFRLVPRPKDPSLLSLGIPILVRGTYLEPVFTPDKGAVMASLLGTAIGGLLLGPVGVLLPLASTGTGEITNCTRLVDEAKEPPPPSASGQRSPEPGLPARAPADTPADDIRGLFRDLDQRVIR